MLARNVDGSLLVTDRNAHVINSIALDGTVSKLLGRTFNCRNDVGNADEVGICDPKQLVVDSQGNVYWGRDQRIMGYNPNTKVVSIIYNGNNGDIGSVGGLTILKDEIYYSDINKHTINKLNWNGSSYEFVAVAGQPNQQMGMWNFDTNQPRGLLEANFQHPSWLTADETNNRIVVSYVENQNGTGIKLVESQ